MLWKHKTSNSRAKLQLSSASAKLRTRKYKSMPHLSSPRRSRSLSNRISTIWMRIRIYTKLRWTWKSATLRRSLKLSKTSLIKSKTLSRMVIAISWVMIKKMPRCLSTWSKSRTKRLGSWSANWALQNRMSVLLAQMLHPYDKANTARQPSIMGLDQSVWMVMAV